MVPARAEPVETLGNGLPAQALEPVRRVAQHAHKAVLGDRAGGPALGAMVREPIVRHLVMHVGRIEQGNQYVDVEQYDAAHRAYSSRSSLTSAMVIGGEPGRRFGSSGTPLRTRTDGSGEASPLRARSLSISPVVQIR